MSATHHTVSKMIALLITASSMDATICEIADKIAMHLIIRSAIENAMTLIKSQSSGGCQCATLEQLIQQDLSVEQLRMLLFNVVEQADKQDKELKQLKQVSQQSYEEKLQLSKKQFMLMKQFILVQKLTARLEQTEKRDKEVQQSEQE